MSRTGNLGDQGIAQKADHLAGEMGRALAFDQQLVDDAQHLFAAVGVDGGHHLLQHGGIDGADQLANQRGGERQCHSRQWPGP